jgi:hypothetical protein
VRPDERLTERFGPGRPIMPTQAEEAPRLFQYRPGINLVSMPRAGFGLVPFDSLRNLAATCKEIRLNIELIKRQIRGLEWEITSDDRNAPTAADKLAIDKATRAFERPDGFHDFDAWVNELLEEQLTTDAVTIWPEMDLGGRLLGLEVIDGTTIRPLLDLRGRICRPPAPAYIQMLHGMAAGAWSRDRLIYRPLNTAVHSPYGTSPIEWMLMTVNLALRRELNHVAAFTEGNIPEALIGAPASWTQTQIETWQGYWDALAAGNTAVLRKMHWVPLESGRGTLPIYEFRKDDISSIERDKWLMQVACWAFGNSPAEFGLTSGDGLGGKGFGESQENVQYRSMIGPLTQYLARLFTEVLRERLGLRGLRWHWKGLDPQEDRLQQAQVDEIYLRSGVYSPSFVQDRLGVGAAFRPEPGSVNPLAQAPSPFGGFGLPFGQAAALPAGEATQADLRRWLTKSLKAVKAGRAAAVAFSSQAITDDCMAQIEAGLEDAQSETEVRQVFARASREAAHPDFFRQGQGWESYG